MDILTIVIISFILGGVVGASLYRWHLRALGELNARHERELQHLDEGLKGLGCRYGQQYDPSYHTTQHGKDWTPIDFSPIINFRDPRPGYVIQYEREGHFEPEAPDAKAARLEREGVRKGMLFPDGEGIRL